MSEQVDNVPNIPSGGLSEELADKYNGTKVKIAKISPVEDHESDYAIAKVKINNVEYAPGQKLPLGTKVPAKRITVYSEPYGTDAAGNPLVAKLKINLKLSSGIWGFSQHEKSTSYRLCKMLKINHVKDCIGREVVLVKTSYKINNKDVSDIVFSIPS